LRPKSTWPEPLSGARLGVLILPEQCGPAGRELWRRAEQAGFAHGWTFDHLRWRGRPETAWFDAIVTLAEAAAVTSRIPLGPLVVTPNFRHPVTLAKQVMTLDHVSGGRLVLGLGAGAAGDDSLAVGGVELSAAGRAGRFEEFIELTDRLLRERVTTYRGQFFEAAAVSMVPGCLQSPRLPLAIAAPRPRGLRLAARCADIWVSNGPAGDPGELTERQVYAQVARQVDQLAETCAEVGRDFGSLAKLIYVSRFLPAVCESPGRIAETIGRCADLGFTDVVIGWPGPDGPLTGSSDALAQVAADLATSLT
jgi:alkanesulfonate monooxygenase SsuD/methylene tetrahydromethanopterin reductase-like flavin-dependent oxidoreductase (luciferase family)